MLNTPARTSFLFFAACALAACADSGIDGVDVAAASVEAQALAPSPSPTCVNLTRAAGIDVEDSTLERSVARGAALTLESDASRRMALQFDLTTLPTGAQITSAALVLRCRDNGKTAPPRKPANIRRITRAWTEGTVTQTNLQNFIAAVPAGTIPFGVTNRQVVVQRSTDLKALAAAWLTDPRSNHGVAIDEDSTKGTICQSSEASSGAPVLEVCFNVVDECADSPCFPGVTCTDVAGPGVTCGACPDGFEGDGITCTDFDACTDSPCFTGVTCTDQPAPSLTATCGACPAGFVGDGITCTPSAPPQTCPPGFVGIPPACTPIIVTPCPAPGVLIGGFCFFP